MPTDNQTVYVTVYTNKWPDDGFEIGGVYGSESLAEKAAETHADAEQMTELGWENVAVREFEVQEREDQDDD
jgi:hypothetical protein